MGGAKLLKRPKSLWTSHHKRVDGIIACAEAITEEFRNQYFFHKKKFITSYPPIDFDFLNGEALESPAENAIELDPSQLKLLFLGSARKVKGFDILYKAWDRLPEKLKNQTHIFHIGDPRDWGAQLKNNSKLYQEFQNLGYANAKERFCSKTTTEQLIKDFALIVKSKKL